MIIFKCDFCDSVKKCIDREINGRVYDICQECWSPIEEKLRGKGRQKTETLFILPTEMKPNKEREERKPAPGEPPIIYGERPN